LTSTEDLPALKTFYSKALRVRQRAQKGGNPLVVQNQDRIIPILALRIESLEDTRLASLPDEELANRLRAELAQMEAGLDEAHEAGMVTVEKYLERRIEDLRASIAEGEETAGDPTQE